MNRFFSKLDLRDIRIDPRSSRFGPDEGEDVGEAAGAAGAGAPQQPRSAGPISGDGSIPSTTPSVPSWRSSDVTAPLATAEEPAAPGEAVDRRDGPAVHGGIAVCDDILKVSARSRPSAVAGAIAGVVREAGRAEVQAIGAGATNQAVKAVAIARDYLQETGIEVICLPGFIDVTIGDEDRTAIRLVIEPR